MSLLRGLLLGEVLMGLSERFLSSRQKKLWQSILGIGLGEGGFWTAVLGVAVDSSTAVGLGVSLVAHDWEDRDKWLKSIRKRFDSVVYPKGVPIGIQD